MQFDFFHDWFLNNYLIHALHLFITLQDQKKINDQLAAEQEKLFGSKLTPGPSPQGMWLEPGLTVAVVQLMARRYGGSRPSRAVAGLRAGMGGGM